MFENFCQSRFDKDCLQFADVKFDENCMLNISYFTRVIKEQCTIFMYIQLLQTFSRFD